MKTGVVRLAVALVLFGFASGGRSARAADQVPRQWKEMSLQDVDPFPFEWKKDLCRPYVLGRADSGWRACDLEIRAAGTSKTLGINLMWLEKEPVEDCQRILTRHCHGQDRVAGGYFVSNYDPAEKTLFPSDERRRLLVELIARIELYAIPCRCGQVAIGRPDDVSPTPSSARQEGGPNIERSDLPPHEVVDTPNVLGQDADAFESHDGQRRAYVRSGGLPPDVQVRSVRFYPVDASSDDPPPEQRRYLSRFPPGVAYISTELNLGYPKRSDRYAFKMWVFITKDGAPYSSFWHEGVLEPGWTGSSHTAIWGRQGGGFWKPGHYKAEIKVDGKVVATGEFDVAQPIP